ncbi:hypothetical protein [Candidatus Nanohalococcus occultus]|uniref:hypothetical protein n=1 Tax=Candidatus Nanohalococcus occultus TaxID=2978047 RepID=UPI0039E0488A
MGRYISSHSKGQTFMPDYTASLLIFGVLIAIFLTSWNALVSVDTSGSEMLQTRHTSTFLVSTQGYPSNWEQDGSNVTIPGFAEEDHVLSAEKLREFREYSYDEQKTLLQAQEFWLEIKNSSQVLELDGEGLEYGRSYENASQIYPVRRNTLLNKSGDLVDAELVYISWE